jgi:hypothetical protein
VSNVFEMMEREWVWLCRCRHPARQLADVHRLAGDATSLSEVERYMRRATPADADRVLLALVSRAARDDLAARVLLQLLLPGMRKLARQWWALGDHDERAAATVAAVYRRIRHYPLERRPGRIAANVLMDAARELRRAVPPAGVVVCADPAVAADADDHANASDGPHPAIELTHLLRDAIHNGVIDSTQGELIARSRIAGRPLAQLASERGMPRRTLFAHRQRAERALSTAYRQLA